MYLNKKNIINFFDKASYTWDEEGADAAGAERILSLPQIRENVEETRVLDVGCGTGVMVPCLLAAGAKCVTAIDISEKMIQVAKRKFKDERVKFLVKDIWDVEEKFDIVMMYNVYPHIQNHEKLAKKLHNILRPNGRFVIAHGDGKDEINKHHKQHASEISDMLLSAEEEAENYNDLFNIDTLIDNPDTYCISGILK